MERVRSINIFSDGHEHEIIVEERFLRNLTAGTSRRRIAVLKFDEVNREEDAESDDGTSE